MTLPLQTHVAVDGTCNSCNIGISDLPDMMPDTLPFDGLKAARARNLKPPLYL